MVDCGVRILHSAIDASALGYPARGSTRGSHYSPSLLGGGMRRSSWSMFRTTGNPIDRGTLAAPFATSAFCGGRACMPHIGGHVNHVGDCAMDHLGMSPILMTPAPKRRWFRFSLRTFLWA